LGNRSTIDYLSQYVDLKSVWHPSFPGKEPTFAYEWMSVRDTLSTRQGQHVLVGHSMGGMIARYVYLSAPDIQQNVAGIITVATPHQGAIMADSAEKLGYYIQVMQDRISAAKPWLEVAAVIIVDATFGIIYGLLILDNNAPHLEGGTSGQDFLESKGLPSLRTTSGEVSTLNNGNADAAVPRANIVGRLTSNKYMALRIAATSRGRDEQSFIDNFNKAKAWFTACKWFYKATVIGLNPGKKCGMAARTMDHLNEMWQRYSSGTTCKMLMNRCALIVARDVPSDGIVPNERSLYPFRSSGAQFFEKLPVLGSTHFSIYQKEEGVRTIRDAMWDIQMVRRTP
jgi:hypothetical protein